MLLPLDPERLKKAYTALQRRVRTNRLNEQPAAARKHVVYIDLTRRQTVAFFAAAIAISLLGPQLVAWALGAH
jgi:uncharacterized protein GlcG (DUF336 family)